MTATITIGDTLCQLDDCARRAYARSMCEMHYRRQVDIERGEVCSIDGCGRFARTKGMCKTHYWRSRSGWDPTQCIAKDCTATSVDGSLCQEHIDARKAAEVCSVEGCDVRARYRGLCLHHYRPTLKVPCKVEGCTALSWGRSMCKKHYRQARKGEDATVCPVPDCDEATKGGRVCAAHHDVWLAVNRQWRGGLGEPVAGWWMPDRPTPCTVMPGDLWFDADARRAAAALCGECPVLMQCKAHTIEQRPKCGMWAGHWFGSGDAL